VVDFGITAEQREIRQSVRSFVTNEVLPLEAEVTRRRCANGDFVTRDEIRELQRRGRKHGFWGAATPEEYGGLALDFVTQSLIETELGRSYLGFRFGGEADNILYHGNAEQRAQYLIPTIAGERVSCFALTEPGAGSDAAAIRTRAKRDGDDWILNGEKTFITFGQYADFAIVIAVTDKDKGARGGFTAFLVDREMGWTSSPIPTMGGACPASLSFQDVRVPHRNVLGEVGAGFPLAMEWIGKGRIVIPSRALGAAERVLEMAVGYANDRETFGAPIGTNQAVAWPLADSEVELEAARWLVLKAAWTIDSGASGRHACAMAKLFATNMANRVIDRALQIHGGMGYTREMPIEQFYRDARLGRIFEGTDEMLRLIISRDLLRGYTKIGSQFD
jgi:alkylation response protein AidB-like acyl-CoA dehydrogenase